jgi:amidase
VAVAANLCAGAVGTETDGSIVCPAHTNGIVGIKPTLGLISRSGVIPIAHSQDTAGPMTRNVEDAAILLGCLAGFDPDDNATHSLRDIKIPLYASSLDKNALRSARLGIAREFFGFNHKVDMLVDDAIEIMRKLGAEIIDPVSLVNPRKFSTSEIQVLLYEFKEDLNEYLSRLEPKASVKSFKSLIEFNEQHRESVMPYFGQERILAAQKKGSLNSKKYLRALERARRLAGAEGIDTAVQTHSLDAIIAPTGNPAWLIDWINGDHSAGPDTSSLPAVAGYPHITVPAGYVFGLPVGISFIGKAWHEPRLIQLAYAFEQASQFRRAPQFLPTVDFGSK